MEIQVTLPEIPQIRQTLSDELKQDDLQQLKISQTVSDLSTAGSMANNVLPNVINASLLKNNLSFSHFIDLLKGNSGAKRRFYECTLFAITGASGT